jgi:hypothetical protein
VNGSEPKRSGPELGAVALLRLDHPELRELAVAYAGMEGGRVVKRPSLYAPPLPRSSSSPAPRRWRRYVRWLWKAPRRGGEGLLRSGHAQRPAHRCRRRAAHAGSVAALSAAIAAASTESVAPLSPELGEDASGPAGQARTGASGSCSWRRLRLGDELARPRVPRRALRLRSRACAVPAAFDRRVRADVAAPRRSARRAAVPRRRLTRWWWWRRASPRWQHAAPPS